MAAPLPPRTYVCPSCGWKKHVTSTSDALIEGISGFRNCQKCGNGHLEVHASNTLETLRGGLGWIGDLIGLSLQGTTRDRRDLHGNRIC
jgi:hypothetical protein